MQLTSVISLLLIIASAAQAAINDPCTANGVTGVCITTSDCSSGGGTSYNGFCPNDPADVQCCTKTSGNAPRAPKTPPIPTRNCKAHVVAAGKIILAQFPGAIHTVYCYANKPGDHGRGLALDLMVKNRSPIGRTIAEWVMNNHGRLRVKYVIWGQRIWELTVDKKPKPWTNWKRMGNRGSDTANHWDHPHISFRA